ncbi:MAG: transcriptional repressor [Candidatus Peribacteria bacterium]|nr:transcriptional repressor [Candidatus Peribacteria bacterium]
MNTTSSIAHLLKAQGLRDTQPRRMVMQALIHIQSPASPYDIQKWITAQENTINTVTVYRVLEVFESLGLVHRHPSSGLYFPCSIPEIKGHHGFLHCTKCHLVEEFHNPELCVIENAIAKKAGFKAKNHLSEIVGVCKGCVL